MNERKPGQKERTECSHRSCQCSSTDIEREGKSYCSEGCAGGEGCDHPGCGCASGKR